MIDPTRLAAIKALCEKQRKTGDEYILVPLDFASAAADPEYGLQALTAEVERLQEREKPVKLSLTKLMNSNRFINPPACKCGKLMMDRWSYCPNCGRRLEWK